jgi:hypothetical protein
MEWMDADFYWICFAKADEHGLVCATFSFISTALFPDCVMSTIGDISLRLRIFYDATLLFFTIKELRGIKAMEHGCSGWNGWTRIFLWICFAKADEHGLVCATFSFISTALFPDCVMSTIGDISLRLRIFL